MPWYKVRTKIVRDGKVYLPGDRIQMTTDEATEHYLNHDFCIIIEDKKHLEEIKEAMSEIRIRSREKTLLKRADSLGISRKEVKNGLLNKD